MKKKKPAKNFPIRFEGLDALRFFAFLGVFTEHMSITAWPGARPSFFAELSNGFFYRGYLGVCFFFVLSAFLITTLLLREQDRNGQINITKFYMRRVLRIWPLYFLVLATGFFILPTFDPAFRDQPASLFNYVFFLANFDFINHGLPINPLLLPLWSLAVEEQFYLLFPWLMRYAGRIAIPFLMLLLIIACMMFRHGFAGHYAENYITIAVHSLSVGIDLGIGVLLAYLVYYAKETSVVRKGIPTWTSFMILLAGFALVFSMRFDFGPLWLSRLTYAIFFAFIIWDQSINPLQKIKLAGIKVLAWLGTISYGLYCLHQAVLYGLTRMAVSFEFSLEASWLRYAFIYLIALVFTIMLAALSYYAYERHFLKLKTRFAS